MKNAGYIMTLALVLTLCLSLTAFARAVNFGHVAPPFHGTAKGVEAFAAYVNEKTKGRIKIAAFPSGQLGGERSMAEQVQGGTLPLASVSTAVLQNFVKETAILDMPFLFPNRATAYAVLDDGKVQEKIFSYLPKKGFIGIGWTENEFRDFSNTKRPIHSPEDVKGLKVRVMNSPAYLDAFKQLGASPVAIPFPEIYNALQTGVIDAQENPILTSTLMKFTEVTHHVTKTQHALTECIIIVGVDYWESLSPKDQKIFREAAKLCTRVNRRVNAKLHQSLPKLGISVDEYAQKHQIEIKELTPQERQAFKTAMVPMWKKYRKRIGNKLFDFMLDKIKEHQL
ncbi:MAG: DctP family TRAP transporter solute-binding subunit [Desulfovibrionales bacterium]|nr:DctP family TRAP transporter solute-binding subunit [Desulfovibrionales bacterium]